MDYKIIAKVILDTLRLDDINYPVCDVLTFACDNDRYIDIDGKMYSPLINTIEDGLASRGVSCTSISRIASVIKGGLSCGRVYSPEGAFARAMIIKRLKSLFTKSGKYSFSYMEVKVWERILDVTQAKAVVAILPSRELCSVCRRRGIWVVDIQHGVIADEHYWYGESFRKDDPVEWLPNSYMVWDAGSQEVIKKWAAKSGVNVDIIGNPWVYRFRNPSFSDDVVGYLTRKYSIERSGKPNVLVSLSWGGHGLDGRYIHPSLEQFIKNTVNDYNWRIRLHPNQLQGFATDEGVGFAGYFNDAFPFGAVEWEDTTSMPLPLLLSEIDIHVTWLSSVCMEAAYFGIPSLVLSPKLQAGGELESYYNYLAEAGYVTKEMPELENIEKWFAKIKGIGRLDFYTDHLNNYERFLSRLVSVAKR